MNNRKYLVYTLFALLAANLSWNFNGPTQTMDLASETATAITSWTDGTNSYTFEAEYREYKRNVVVHDRGDRNLREETIHEYKLTKAEGVENADDLIGHEFTLNDGDDLQDALKEIIAKVEADAKAAEEAEAAKARREAREEEDKKKATCNFRDEEKFMNCADERIEELADLLDSRDSLEGHELCGERDETACKRYLKDLYDRLTNKVTDYAENYYEEMRSVNIRRIELSTDMNRINDEIRVLEQRMWFSSFEDQRNIRQDIRNLRQQRRDISLDISGLDDDYSDVKADYEDFESYAQSRILSRTLKDMERANKNYSNFVEDSQIIGQYRHLAEIDIVNRPTYDAMANSIEDNLDLAFEREVDRLDRQIDTRYRGGLNRSVVDAYLASYQDLRARIASNDFTSTDRIRTSTSTSSNISTSMRPVRTSIDTSRSYSTPRTTYRPSSNRGSYRR